MSVVEDYQDQTEALAASTAASVLELYSAMLAGGMTPTAASEAMAAVVNVANAAATTLADLFVTAQIEVAVGQPAPPTGIAPTDEGPRLVKAVETILDDLDDEVEDTDDPTEGTESAETHPVETAAIRLERLARAEPLESGHVAVEVVIERLPQAEGWTRVLDADPCERCQRWAEDGRVFPKDHHFKRHLNCNCQQQIVLSNIETSSDTMKEEKAS